MGHRFLQIYTDVINIIRNFPINPGKLHDTRLAH